MVGSIAMEDYRRLSAEIGMAGLDSSRWKNVLQALWHLSGGVKAHFMGYDPDGAIADPGYGVGYDDGFLQEFAAYYRTINPWGQKFFDAPSLTTMSTEEMYPRAELVRTEFWDGWSRPQGDLTAGGGTVLINEPRRKFILGGNIAYRDQDRLETPWLGLCRFVAPQMVAALEVSRALSGLRLEAWLLRNGEEPAASSVFVIDASLRPISMNTAATAMIEEGRLIRIDMLGRLRFPDLESDAAVRAAMRVPSLGRISCSDGDGVAHDVRIVHMPESRVEDLLPFPDCQVAAMPLTVLIVGSNSSAGPNAAELLMERMELTRSEAEVTLFLASGLSLEEICERREVRLVTVRNQMKSALSKTGARRQAALVAMVRNVIGTAFP